MYSIFPLGDLFKYISRESKEEGELFSMTMKYFVDQRFY